MEVLFFDTESTALDGDWGRILCATFSPLGGETYSLRKDIAPLRGRTRIDDAKIVVACREKIEAADIIVGWNSILHDIPLLNARLAAAGERPIRTGEKHGTMHLDLMYYAGGQSIKIGSRRLDNVAHFFGTENQKTKLSGEIWQLAASGDHDAMDQIVEHCEADVDVLKELWPKLAPNVKKFQFPISEVWSFIGEIPSRSGK